MRSRDLMKAPARHCRESATIADAAACMRAHGIGFLPVCDDDGLVVGALTDRDVTLRVLALGREPARTRVADVMTRFVVACNDDDEIGDAAELMRTLQKSRIVVRDRALRLAGVLSLSRLARTPRSSSYAGHVAAAVAMREAATIEAPLRAANDVVCGEVMRREIVRCKRDDDVRVVAVLMRDHDIGFIPVEDDDGTIVGTLTDRDLAVRVVAARRPPATTRAGDLLSSSSELVTCAPGDTLAVAELTMIERKKSRIVCIDERIRACGIISLSDIARLEPPDEVARVVAGVCSRAA